MSAGLSRALIVLAGGCLGESRREWAVAMEVELEAAIEDRRSLSFATGCLFAAIRQLPAEAEGRLKLASHALALGLLVPIAFLQFACAIGLSCGAGGVYGGLAVVGASDPLLESAQLGAVPGLLILWLLLGIGHLQLAWTLLERDWQGLAKAGALIAAATLTLFIVMGVLMLDAAALWLLAAALAVELMVVLAVALWHARLAAPYGWPQSVW